MSAESHSYKRIIMRKDNLLVQPIDASDGMMYVIMDESTGNEIYLTRDQIIWLKRAIEQVL